MPLLVLALLVFVLLAPVVLLPLSIVQRYRVGTARRPARAWVATLNAAGFSLSAVVGVVVAAITSWWAPGALTATAGGLVLGALLGSAGLLLSRWESQGGILHFTPNRWLVLAVTVLVVARLGYGVWRGWHAWGVAADQSWLAEAGVAGSLAAGAVVIGYGLAFWTGVRWRIGRRRIDRVLSL